MRLNKWLHSIADAGREILFGRDALAKHTRQPVLKSIETLCAELYSSKGEALGTALARDVVKAYSLMSNIERTDFFVLLLKDYSPDLAKIVVCAENYKQRSDYHHLQALTRAVEAPRQELLRRINMAPNGTQTIVSMREHLLQLLPQYPDMKVIDADFLHLLNSWFNRGFLHLKKIDWKTSADILEKLITYEAVHAIEGWDDLHRRLADDRRCYAFFHPALPDEPLIFVQVALVNELSNSIQALLEPKDRLNNEVEWNTAVFYSISDCQKGLRGISFGNFLIKQVVMELCDEMPSINQFATLSPMPGFCQWLDAQLTDKANHLIMAEEKNLLVHLNVDCWYKDTHKADALKPILIKLASYYLYHEKKHGKPIDPVARFHLRNGAIIERLNWLGDISMKGLHQSAGMLVNYCYNLAEVEKNHEAFVNSNKVSSSEEFMSSIK